jgi:thiopurine S-methyltransferase
MSKPADVTRPELHDFWLQRWEQNDIGWHHQEFNPHLTGFWSQAEVAAGEQVLVPLCGKSRDMVWLSEQGYSVLGVELSPLAVAGFFEEQKLTPKVSEAGSFQRWQAGPFQILCGDIFQLERHHVQGVAGVYDRASLVALNPEQRNSYALLLNHILPNDCSVLLVAMDYPQLEMKGPPYCVPPDEVQDLFRSKFEVTLVHDLDLLRETARYRDKGLSRLSEQIWLLRKI